MFEQQKELDQETEIERRRFEQESERATYEVECQKIDL